MPVTATTPPMTARTRRDGRRNVGILQNTLTSARGLGARLPHRRVSHSGSFDESEKEDKNHCADSGNDDASKQAPASGEAKKAKQKSSEHSSQHSNDEVSN